MKRSLAITSACLGLVWLVSTGVLFFYAANLAPVPALLLAFVAQDGAFGLALALLITTNTRRPWSEERDPYAATTAELTERAVLLPDGRPYGRRAIDDRHVVDRLSEILEDEASRRPAPENAPPWAIGLHRDHQAAADQFADPQREEE